ncbi:hypothetical protein GH714_013212 [Hevea brasiliensis]|uniref:Integrase catalytic domain-containing protein n=1 Tax=Hevea brasiliensis TaxID=3981 RepID=A0A6A6NGV1_HEVBR|nr:hypothetical protein GH714_013212 [Hevea brasiliensis]
MISGQEDYALIAMKFIPKATNANDYSGLMVLKNPYKGTKKENSKKNLTPKSHYSHWVSKLGLPWEPIEKLQVTMVNGSKIKSPGLPISQGKNVLLVVVDRFSKYAHILNLSHPYMAVSVAHLFFDNIFKLYGLSETIISDRDVTFTSSFWTELFRLSGTKLSFSSAYHPQSDGQTEVVNRTIEMYLCCFTSDRPCHWFQWLSWVEYYYNTSYHFSLKATPFEVVYGRSPLKMLSYCPGLAKLDAVDQELKAQDMVQLDLRNRLLQAQNDMKTIYDSKHR